MISFSFRKLNYLFTAFVNNNIFSELLKATRYIKRQYLLVAKRNLRTMRSFISSFSIRIEELGRFCRSEQIIANATLGASPKTASLFFIVIYSASFFINNFFRLALKTQKKMSNCAFPLTSPHLPSTTTLKMQL